MQSIVPKKKTVQHQVHLDANYGIEYSVLIVKWSPTRHANTPHTSLLSVSTQAEMPFLLLPMQIGDVHAWMLIDLGVSHSYNSA